MSEKVVAYGLAKEFEQVLAILCATRPKFFGAVGRELELKALEDPTSQLILKASRAIAKELGTGPSSPTIVLQRLQRWSEEGNITRVQVGEALDLLLEPPHALPSDEEALAEIVPILQQRVRRQAVRVAMDDVAKRGDLGDVAKMITHASGIGKIDKAPGLKMSNQLFARIKEMGAFDRMPTGIPELDVVLEGGTARGEMLCWIGGSGSGKSMALVHNAATALRLGELVLVATLELSEVRWQTRVLANLTNIPTNSILNVEPRATADAQRAFATMAPRLGTLIVKDFPAKVTTVPDILDWIKTTEEEEGREARVVIVDYADKLTIPRRGDRKEYDVAGEVYEALRVYASGAGKWLFTASQAIRRAGGGTERMVGLDDGADSQHKVRVTDAAVTLTPRGENREEILYFVAKNRNGESGQVVGPLPHAWALGQMVPL